MRFADFEQRARKAWDDVPSSFKQGVDGLIVEHDAKPDEERPDVFLMGECVTESYPSDYGGPDTTRSAVVLYYGSFAEIAADDAGFDWDAEINDTITHELQHHLEALATEDGMGDFDWAVQENFNRIDGDPFDPLFFRAGEPIAEGLYHVEGDVFVELLTADTGDIVYEFEWDDAAYRVNLPPSGFNVTYYYLEEGPLVAGEFYIVRVQKQGTLSALKALFQSELSVTELTVTAELLK